MRAIKCNVCNSVIYINVKNNNGVQCFNAGCPVVKSEKERLDLENRNLTWAVIMFLGLAIAGAFLAAAFKG
jgi:hypothetical protein